MDLAVAAVAGAAVVWVPGAILLRLLRRGMPDFLARVAAEVALGIAFWPILFLLTSVAGFRWTAVTARVLMGILVAALCALLVKRPAAIRRPDASGVAAIVLVAIVCFTRIRHIDGITYPLWVDSVHHTMIIRLLADHGALPDSYAPFIEDSTFYYHWGFHAVAAFGAWVAGMTGPDAAPRFLLGFGQLLNALVFFAVSCGGKLLFRSRQTALLAATLATLVSYFPAYYVSWGRYTQLCGVLILPPLVDALWRLGRRPEWRRAIEVVLLGGALLLIHVLVAVVLAVAGAIAVLLLALQRRWRGIAWCAAAGAAAVLLTAPWLLQLVRTPQVRTILAPEPRDLTRWDRPNDIPEDLLWAPHNAPLFSLATAGLLGLTPAGGVSRTLRAVSIAWWIVLVVLLQRRTRRSRHPDRRDRWRIGVLVSWVVITAVLVNLELLGLPRLRLLTNSAAVIMLFLPASLLAAHLVRWAGNELTPSRRRRLVWTAATLAIGVAGAATMLRIVNPVTVLVTEADRKALRWIGEHVPATSRFAVGVQPWLADSYIGTDGGYWIPLVSERASILPPGLYPWVMSTERAAAATSLLTAWYEGQQAGDLAVIDRLRREGVTHVYFGARNRSAIRERMAAVARPLHSEAGVDIYRIR